MQRQHEVWCVYLRSRADAELPAAQSDQLVAALPLDADETRIAGTIRATIAAQLSKNAG